MALTVALVRLLNPEGKSDTGAVYLATSFYVEEVRLQGLVGGESCRLAAEVEPQRCFGLSLRQPTTMEPTTTQQC